MAGGVFNARVGFGAEIVIVAGAEIEVDKSSASRGADGNIEGLDVNDLAAGLIALGWPRFFLVESLGRIENVDIALIAAFLAIFKGPG